MDGVGTPIIGRPRPLPGHDTPNPAYHPHTLNYEEPDKVSQNDLRNRIINQASVAIDGVKSGRVVVRVCPTNRRWAATILTEVGLSVIEA